MHATRLLGKLYTNKMLFVMLGDTRVLRRSFESGPSQVHTHGEAATGDLKMSSTPPMPLHHGHRRPPPGCSTSPMLLCANTQAPTLQTTAVHQPNATMNSRICSKPSALSSVLSSTSTSSARPPPCPHRRPPNHEWATPRRKHGSPQKHVENNTRDNTMNHYTTEIKKYMQ